MGKSDIHEERSDEWVRVDARMPDLVGSAAMMPGVLLWLDDGHRLLVGDVNECFGVGAHCTYPILPLVRAYRRVFDTSRLQTTSPSNWANAFELDEVPFEYCEESEYPTVAQLAMPLNRIQDLELDGTLRPGLVVGMDDGRALLVGHVNALAGVCDADVDGHGYDGRDHRITRYFRAVSDAMFKRRPYER